ncbi:MAG: hypothetical protein IH585_06430, partial [Anaerolineaceae bacterium]|nr:hypothetical protein [Anaerolineaceae bacterium]
MNSQPKENQYAFVIMPFAKKYDPVYQRIIKPAVELCEIKCKRADEDSQGHIHQQMLEKIFEANVIIADISSFNPNVFYELGVAHSNGSKTIMICDIENLDKVPFDIAPFRVLSYQNPEVNLKIDETIRSLSNEILRVINYENEGIINPVQDYKNSQSPVRSSTSLFINELTASAEE